MITNSNRILDLVNGIRINLYDYMNLDWDSPSATRVQQHLESTIEDSSQVKTSSIKVRSLKTQRTEMFSTFPLSLKKV